MAQIIDTSQLTIFSSLTGGLVLAYALGVFLTRSSFQFDQLGPMKLNSRSPQPRLKM
jgi:hypothetical protein